MHYRNSENQGGGGGGQHLVAVAEQQHGIGPETVKRFRHALHGLCHHQRARGIIVRTDIGWHTAGNIETIGLDFAIRIAITLDEVHVCGHNVDAQQPPVAQGTAHRRQQAPVGTGTGHNTKAFLHLVFHN